MPEIIGQIKALAFGCRFMNNLLDYSPDFYLYEYAEMRYTEHIQ